MSTLHKDTSECYFCGSKLQVDKYGDYTEEVGEFWNMNVQQSVLGHPDCTPNGVEAMLMEKDPVWRLA